jgi:N-acetylmuramic acid 6-phosphate etherase
MHGNMDLASLSQLQTEAVNPQTAQIDQISTLEMCRLINEEDHRVPPSVTPCIPEIAAAIDALTPRVRNGGRVIYVGAGTSGRPVPPKKGHRKGCVTNSDDQTRDP